jgi:hypothetical protein
VRVLTGTAATVRFGRARQALLAAHTDQWGLRVTDPHRRTMHRARPIAHDRPLRPITEAVVPRLLTTVEAAVLPTAAILAEATPAVVEATPAVTGNVIKSFATKKATRVGGLPYF